MWELLRSIKKAYTWTAVLYMILGVILLIWPAATTVTICIIVGAVICIHGIGYVISYCRNPEVSIFRFNLILGIVGICIGCFLMFQPDTFLSVIPFAFGVIVIVDGVTNIQKSLDLKRMYDNKWWGAMVGGIVALILGLLLMLNPFSTTVALVRFLGIVLIVDGACDIWTVFKLTRR